MAAGQLALKSEELTSTVWTPARDRPAALRSGRA